MKTSVIKNSFLPVFVLIFIFGFSYWYPRFLVSLLGEKSPWISYSYTYGMGLVFFLLSVFWIFTRAGVDPMRRKLEIQWLIAIICGLLFMFFLQGLWIFTADNFPIKN